MTTTVALVATTAVHTLDGEKTHKRRSNNELIQEKKQLNEARHQKQAADQRYAIEYCKELRNKWMSLGMKWGHVILHDLTLSKSVPIPSSSSASPSNSMTLTSLEQDLPPNTLEFSESTTLEAWLVVMRNVWSLFVQRSPITHIHTQYCQRAIQFFIHKLWKRCIYQYNAILYMQKIGQALVSFITKGIPPAPPLGDTKHKIEEKDKEDKEEKEELYSTLPPVLDEFLTNTQGLFFCHHCGQNNVTFFNYSLCRGDEGMKIVTRCLNKKCKKTWIS